MSKRDLEQQIKDLQAINDRLAIENRELRDDNNRLYDVNGMFDREIADIKKQLTSTENALSEVELGFNRNQMLVDTQAYCLILMRSENLKLLEETEKLKKRINLRG